MDDSTLRYWVGFNLAKGIGPLRLHALIEHFGDVERAWKAPVSALQAAGLDQRSLNSLLAVRASRNLDAELRAVERAGAWIVTLDDDQYPAALRTIRDAPPLLYVKGSLNNVHNAVAVVGTRRATTYGKTMTREIVTPLIEAGIVIVSGLARGIDAEAHQAALDAGGRTIAVLPNGIDRVYPPEHQQLAEAIAAHGALLTELPLGEPAESAHFAPRNRLVSGLSRLVLIVEAGERSGALMTATLALDQGRDVLAVPGNALSPASKGANNLIQSGARMVTSAADVLSELGLDPEVPHPGSRMAMAPTSPELELALPGSDAEAVILRALTAEPQYIDALSYQIGLPAGDVSSTLLILELKGLVRQVGVMQYALAKRTS